MWKIISDNVLIWAVPVSIIFGIITNAIWDLTKFSWHPVTRHLRLVLGTRYDPVDNGRFRYKGFEAAIRVIEARPRGFQAGFFRLYAPENNPVREFFDRSLQTLEKVRKLVQRDALLSPYQEEFGRIAERWQSPDVRRTVYDNENCVGLTSFIPISRDGTAEDKLVQIEPRRTSYILHRIVTEFYASLPADKRNVVAEQYAAGGGSVFGMNVAVAVAVVTEDGKLVIGKRSLASKPDPGKYICVIGEGLVTEDLQNTFDAPTAASIRGFKDEICDSATRPLDQPFESKLAAALRFTMFALSEAYCEYYLFGIFDLRNMELGITSTHILDERAKGGVKDSSENQALSFIPFNEKAVLAELTKHRHQYTEYGVVSALMAILWDTERKR